MKRFLWALLLLAVIFGNSLGVSATESSVYRVTIDGTINSQNEALLDKAIETADENQAELLIIEINTYGGYIDNAIQMKNAIMSSPVTTVTFVNQEALSAGVLIALAGQRLYMAPGSTIGAAEARQGNEVADEKTTSAWIGELRATAQARGKDDELIAAMADSSVVIEGLSSTGKLLTLTDTQASDLGVSDGTANSYKHVCEFMNVTATETVVIEQTALEKFAGFISHPIVSGILIGFGILGIVLELAIGLSGVGIILGLVSLVVYFAGHMILNSVGWVAIVVFVLGVLLICLEVFVIPGFGVAGIAGGIALIVTLFLLAPSPASALLSLLIAAVIITVVLIVSFKNMKTKKIWRKMVLKERTDRESGYTAPNMDNERYLGQEGVALTILRPAGAIDIDGERIDVVTEGNFLAAGTKVKVISLDGTRIVVRAVKETQPPTARD